MAREAARTQGVILFLYRNHTHKTSHFLTKKKIIYIYIYNIYISLMLRKSVGCAKVPLCPFVQWEAPRGVGICQLGGLSALPLDLVVQSSGGPWGRRPYLDVSMFSSLKLLQCSITLRAISLVSCRAVAILIMSLRRGIPPSLISRGQYLSG